MGEKKSAEWYNAFLKKTGMELFNRGIHLERAEKLSDMLAAHKVGNVIEVAAGGSVLAQKIIAKCNPYSYFWSDFSHVAVESAKEVLDCQNLKVEVLDIDQAYTAMPWEKYDTFVCVSLEHLQNDREIIEAIPRGTLLALSFPDVEAEDHIRVLRTWEEIRERYDKFLIWMHMAELPPFKLALAKRL